MLLLQELDRSPSDCWLALCLILTILWSFSGAPLQALLSQPALNVSDLTVLASAFFFHFPPLLTFLSLDDSIHVYGFIYHLQTDDTQICVFCPNPSPDIINSAASWMTSLGCPVGTSKLSRSSVRLLTLPPMFVFVLFCLQILGVVLTSIHFSKSGTQAIISFLVASLFHPYIWSIPRPINSASKSF